MLNFFRLSSINHNIECYSAPPLRGIFYPYTMIDEYYKSVGFCFSIKSQKEDESTRDRSINPTHADEYLKLFSPYILPLCNVQNGFRITGHIFLTFNICCF